MAYYIYILYALVSALHSSLGCRSNNPSIYTFAGNQLAGNTNDNGLATNAAVHNPSGVVGDKNNIYIASQNGHVIRSVSKTTKIITTIAGIPGNTGAFGNSGLGGPATSALLNKPTGLCLDFLGNLVLADSGNNVMKRINISTGIIDTIVGSGIFDPFVYGESVNPLSATLKSPQGCVYDSHGNLFIADMLNNVIRKVDYSSGLISTYAGDGALQQSGSSGNGGTATNARLNYPYGVAVDPSNNLYIAGTTFIAYTKAVETVLTLNSL